MTTKVVGNRQFRALYRGFLQRFLDLEILSSRGDTQRLFVQIAALLAAFSFVLALSKARQYAIASEKLTAAQFVIATWGDQASLITISMTITALFTILMWDSLFPDRRDCLILSALPIRMRTLFSAKSAAIGTGVGLSFLAINVFTGLLYPFLIKSATPGILGSIRAFAAHWIALIAASLFVFCALLAAQGVALHTLSHSRFARISSYLQVGAFFVTVALFFLTPPILTPTGLIDPKNQILLESIPAFWFLGLFQQLLGAQHPAFAWLAQRAMVALGVAIAIAAVTYLTAYSRHIRRVIETSGTIPADQRKPASRFTQFLVRKIAPHPLDRALFLFITRTLLRSRQHRMVLAFYGGLALGFSLVYLSDLFYPSARPLNRALDIGSRSWFEPNQGMLAASLVILSLTIVGIRVCFTLPVELRANWIFRLTETGNLREYISAMRKALWILGPLPLGIASALVFFSLWPPRPAAAHLVIFALVATLLIERSLSGFHKIPFACSYLPGKANLTVMLGVYAMLFMFFADAGIRIELWSFNKPVRYIVIVALLVYFIQRTRRKASTLLATAESGLVFDERPPADLQLLELQSHEAHFGIKIVDAPTPVTPHRVRRFLVKAAGAVAAIVVAGFVYEQVEELRDRIRFPLTGQRVDIGGRAMHIECAGTGSPAVILESGANHSGYGWAKIQREIAKTARVCTFDRAGFGWSDPGPLPRDGAAIASDLQALLKAAAIPPPYVLVGHSKAGLEIRIYAGTYRDEVAGLVFVDSSHEDQGRYMPDSLRAPASFLPLPIRNSLTWMYPFLAHTGLVRMMSESAAFGGLTAEESAAADALRHSAAAEIAAMHEGLSWPATGEQARAAGTFGDLPLVVLSAGWGRTRLDKDVRQAIDAMIHKLHAEIVQLSSRGRQVIVTDSTHGIPFERPDAVVSAIQEVLSEARESIRAHP